jgi:hypothetical protein
MNYKFYILERLGAAEEDTDSAESRSIDEGMSNIRRNRP